MEDRGMLSVSVLWHGKLWNSTKESSTCLHFCSWAVFSRRPLESLSVQLACCMSSMSWKRGEGEWQEQWKENKSQWSVRVNIEKKKQENKENKSMSRISDTDRQENQGKQGEGERWDNICDRKQCLWCLDRQVSGWKNGKVHMPLCANFPPLLQQLLSS